MISRPKYQSSTSYTEEYA